MKYEKIKQGDMPIIGTNIKRLREKNHLRNTDVVTRLQLAGIALSSSTLSKIERGYSNPTARLLIALTDIFQCDYNAFFEEDKKWEPCKVGAYFTWFFVWSFSLQRQDFVEFAQNTHKIEMALELIDIWWYNTITKKCGRTQKRGTQIWKLREIYILNS